MYLFFCLKQARWPHFLMHEFKLQKIINFLLWIRENLPPLGLAFRTRVALLLLCCWTEMELEYLLGLLGKLTEKESNQTYFVGVAWIVFPPLSGQRTNSETK